MLLMNIRLISKHAMVLRAGMDFRIRCTKCGREVMVPRVKIEKNIKKILREGSAAPEADT